MSSGGSRKALRREWSPYAEYGRQGRLFPTFGRVDAVLVVLLLLGACFFLWRSETIAAYRWSWPELADFLVRRTPGGYEPGLLIRGLIVTLRLGVWSMALALLIGGVLGALSAGKRGVAALPFSFSSIPSVISLLWCCCFSCIFSRATCFPFPIWNRPFAPCLLSSGMRWRGDSPLKASLTAWLRRY